MKISKKQVIALLALVIILGVAAGVWFQKTHVIIEGDPYQNNSQVLDMRGSGISVDYYETLARELPECEILWDVPFQGSFYPEETTELTVTALTREDAQVLKYFLKLQSIDASGCRDYDILMQLRQDFPEVKIRYTVSVGGTEWPQGSRKLSVASLSPEDVKNIAYLPDLRILDAGNCSDLDVLMEIGSLYPYIDLRYSLTAGGETFDRFAKELTLSQADPARLLEILPHMPRLEKLNLISPEGNPSDLLALTETYPSMEITWSREVFGITVSGTDTEADLSGTAPESLDEIRKELTWFPAVEKLILCDLEFDNETMAAFREEMRSEYKVVWNVDVGYLTMRTDEIYYMPGKYNLGVTDEQAYNLRYFEDMICIDVGHKPLFNCEWADFMPNLKYLIIADTMIDDISPLEGHDQLVYLEMFITKVTDLTPLLTCTALEDLNLCYTHADPEPITKMTWLKNLWWAEPPIEEAEFQEYLPDTHLMFLHHSSTGNGWRQLQNYYDMRDILGMHYMWG